MSSIYIDPILHTTKPEDTSRSKKEMDVYDLLETLSIPYIRVDHEATATIDSCLEVEALLEIEICKNLFLCTANQSNFYLLLIPGHKKLVTKELAQQIGSSRLSFAKEDAMAKLLSLTPGSVTVLGLMNDPNHRVQLLIDEEILSYEFIGCHPCVNTSSLKLKTRDILDKFLPYTGHTPITVSL